MKFKFFLISFILSLPFWWGVDTLAGSLENFWFLEEIANRPEVFTAQINQRILERKIKNLKLEKLQAELLKNLEIEAKAAISVELDNKGNEKILFEKNSEDLLPIASLSKLMTALVIFDLDETYSLPQMVTINEEAVEQEGVSRYGDLKARENLSIGALLHIMLIESSNDAAFALSESIGEEGFVGLMNLYAEDIGLRNTHFVNPTGLDPDDLLESVNYSTAGDLVKLAGYVLKKYPQIFEITNNQSYEILRPNGSLHHFIPENTNKLLAEIPEIIGGKTGWSLAAGGCLLLVLEKPEKNGYFINIILGAGDRFREMRKIIEQVNRIQNF